MVHLNSGQFFRQSFYRFEKCGLTLPSLAQAIHLIFYGVCAKGDHSICAPHGTRRPHAAIQCNIATLPNRTESGR
jgi:hypothetical protein